METTFIRYSRRDDFNQHECGSDREWYNDFTEEEFLYYQNLDGEL